MRSNCLMAVVLAGFPGVGWAEVPKVVTDITPVQSLVAQVMGDLGTPSLLMDPGANAHSYQMKPSQARALQGADLLVWVGPEMTPWLARAAEATGAGKAFALLAAPGTEHRDFAPGAADNDDDDGDGDHDHDHHGEAHAHGAHDHDHGHDHHDEGGDEHGHVHEGLDPHAWLDPGNAKVWLGAIAGELSALDPEHAATYAANAASASARIDALDAEITARLAPVRSKPFVVFHAAYGYFAAHYGLDVAGALSFGDATDPGAAHLSELRAGLVSDHIVCAFPESNHDPRPIERLIEGTGVRLGGTLDPEGAALDPGAGMYEKLIRSLSDTIADCLDKG